MRLRWWVNIGIILPDVEYSICGSSPFNDKNLHKRLKLCNSHWLKIKENTLLKLIRKEEI